MEVISAKQPISALGACAACGIVIINKINGGEWEECYTT